MRRLFEPRTIAVAGMSTSRVGPVNRYVAGLRGYGFDGRIYALHPQADVIDGVPAFRSLADMPEPIDYTYIAVPASAVGEVLRGGAGKVGFAQIMTSGFAEESAEGAKREAELVAIAREGGIRLLGPNCLGTHSPRGRITFVEGADTTPGTVGVVSQSGGLGIDLIRRGAQRGLGLSGLVTIGNAADIGVEELVRHFRDASDTSVLGLYLEHVKDGRALFEVLVTMRESMPCVLLKGGSTPQGNRAASSHTGAMTSDARIWTALAQQAGVILVDTLDEFVDTLVCLQHTRFASQHVTGAVAMVGNGGGTSVLGSDAFGRHGIDVPVMDDRTVSALTALNLPPGTSVVNPVDTPAGTVLQREGKVMADILRTVAQDRATDAVVAHMNLPVLLTSTDQPEVLMDNIERGFVEAASSLPPGKHFIAVLRSDGSEQIDHRRSQMASALSRVGIPVVRELADAAKVLAGVRHVEQVRALRS
jgi:acyl-CoA synthetase (NDP forming)